MERLRGGVCNARRGLGGPRDNSFRAIGAALDGWNSGMSIRQQRYPAAVIDCRAEHFTLDCHNINYQIGTLIIPQ
jgi:hypothetical protein